TALKSRAAYLSPAASRGIPLIQEDQACATTSRTSMFLIVTASVTSDGTLSLMVLAASSDSKTTMLNPPSSPRVQYPATNPGACDTPGTTFSRNWLVAASRSLTVTVTTTACMGVSFCRWLARTLSGSQRDDRLTAVGTSPAQYLATPAARRLRGLRIGS